MLITKTYSVDYAHRLKDHQGKCRNLHGHTGVINITFEGEHDTTTGMIIDFGLFKWLEEIVNMLDHVVLLQDTDPLAKILQEFVDEKTSLGINSIRFEYPPTAECLVSFIHDMIVTSSEYQQLEQEVMELVRIDFAETPGNIVSWTKE